MRILTADEIKKVEQKAFNDGTSEAELMLSAGTKCYQKIVKNIDNIDSKNIAVFCGNGKNAGDGFVIADLLKRDGVNVVIVLVDKMPQADEPKMYYEKAMQDSVQSVNLEQYDFKADVIVDCIFGIGFHGLPSSPFDNAFEIINNSGAFVVAVDTPSGTNATTGEAENAVKADLTIAISTLKFAHILPPANDFCGKVVVANIGIDEKYYETCYVNTITKTDVKKNFTLYSVNSHKGTFGHQLNICGSYNMPGASVICAKGAIRCGVGLLKCVIPKSIYTVMTSHLTQCMFKPICENEQKTFSIGGINDILDELNWASSVVIGCGIDCNDDTQVITSQVVKSSQVPIVLDADGINSILSFIDILKDKKAPLIITPHPGEMARLINENVSYVQSNRIEVAKAFAKENDCIVVLKGANTVVTDGKEVYVNTTGNYGMSMGGTGDLLSGMIGSFLAQGFEPIEAAKCAVYIHGLCGDITAKELSHHGMTVDDMIYLLGALMSEFE